MELVNASGAVLQTAATDEVGEFHFDRVAPGQYELRARYEGFKSASAKLRVGTRAPSPQRLVLPLGDLTQEITVSNGATDVGTSSNSNVDAITIDENMLEALPVFDNDFVATMSQFLDAGSIGNGGVTIVVNGMEVSALNVSAAQMQQIRINQDPYSAEYSRPGRGRVEILTKPGTQEYHGQGSMVGATPPSTRATRSRPPSRRSSADLSKASSAGRSARTARPRSRCRPTTRSSTSSRTSMRSGPTGSFRTTCRTGTARRG